MNIGSYHIGFDEIFFYGALVFLFSNPVDNGNFITTVILVLIAAVLRLFGAV